MSFNFMAVNTICNDFEFCGLGPKNYVFELFD